MVPLNANLNLETRWFFQVTCFSCLQDQNRHQFAVHWGDVK